MPPVADEPTPRAASSWRSLPTAVRDSTGAAALLVVSLLPLGVPGVELGELHRSATPWVVVLLVVGQTVPLAFRRIAPATVLAVVGVSFAIAQLLGIDTGTAGLGAFVAIYSVAAYQRTGRRTTDVLAVVGYVALAVGLHLAGSPERLVDWITFFLVLAAPWLVGQIVRRRLAEQTARQRAAATAAVREARVGLARDLHDIVTHHVTAIVVQAESTAYLDDADIAERARTLEIIGTTGRRALQELRSLLGALEQTPDATREPTDRSLVSLVEAARSSGQQVELVGADAVEELSEAVAVTLYRIAQEALTNALRHAPGAPVEITLTASDERMQLTIRNDLTAGAPGPAGRGRHGMADRAALLAGTVTTGVLDGRFVVSASFAPDAEASR